MTVTLTDTGQRFYDAVAPLMQQDSENGYAGQILCAALATMLDPVAYAVRDDGDTDLPGWATLFDAANVQEQWLPWLSQFLGDSQAVMSASTVAAKRALITAPANFTRGTPAGIRATTQATLTGTQTVLIEQRQGGSPWAISVITYNEETPSPTLTTAAILSVMPAWLIPTILTVPFGSYATVEGAHTTYALSEAAHATYSDYPLNPAA